MEIAFLLKKIIGFWLMPLSICVLLMASGLLLLWLNKHIKLGKLLTTTGLLLLMLFSWHPFSTPLLRPIEQSYAQFEISNQVEHVVVLGTGVESDEAVPVTSHLSSSARARLMEGLRILNAQPNAKLIVTGYGGNNSKSSAEVYAHVAMSLGIDGSRITKFEQARDTKEEALFVSKHVGNQSLALVTSASHMPRAYQFFMDAKVNALPAPTFYIAKYTEKTDWKFNSAGLFKSERAIYEYIGQAWAWLNR